MDAPLTVTPAAGRKISELAEREGCEPTLRVAVIGGGCGGFQYQIGFDDRAEGDESFDSEGVTVLIDGFSLPYLRGSAIDFLDGLQESGFKIENPNATSSCGCGHSFSADGVDGEQGCGSCC